MDYSRILGDAFKLLRRSKSLWGMALLVAFLGFSEWQSSVNLNFNSFQNLNNNPSSSSSLPDFQELTGQLETVLQDYALVIVGVGLALLVLSIISTILGSIARGGLIAMVLQLQEKGETRFAYGWQRGWQVALKLWLQTFLVNLPVSLIMILAIGGIVIGSVIPALQANASPSPEQIMGIIAPLLSLFCCVTIVLIPISYLTGLISRFANYDTVAHDVGVWQGIRTSWRFIRANFGRLFIFSLIILGINIGLGVVIGIVTALISLPFAAMAIGTVVVSSNISEMLTPGLLAVGAVWLLLLWGINIILGAGYTIFYNAAWLNVFREGDDSPIASATGESLVAAG